MRRTASATGLAAALAGAMPAQASDFGGLLSGLLIFTIAVPSAVLSLVLFAVLAGAGAYRSRRLARWHAILAGLPPLAGAVATLVEGRSVGDAGDRLLAAGGMLALALLPVLMHVRQGAAAGVTPGPGLSGRPAGRGAVSKPAPGDRLGAGERRDRGGTAA